MRLSDLNRKSVNEPDAIKSRLPRSLGDFIARSNRRNQSVRDLILAQLRRSRGSFSVNFDHLGACRLIRHNFNKHPQSVTGREHNFNSHHDHGGTATV